MRLAGKRVLLIVSGGIAAYKSLELVRLLRAEGSAVTPVLTASGARFVTPLSLATLCETPVHDDLFAETQAGIDHIALSRAADLVVVAPATAQILARMAAGLADDLATTLLLATDKKVLVAPAMNVRMWLHDATQANMRTLASRGIHVIGPEQGAMACNEFGPGRLAEPPAIRDAIVALAGASSRLAGLHAIVTSGPTHEPIDPVRYIANRSSGRQGHAVAAALAALGARVSLVHGPVAIPTPPGVAAIPVETASAMLEACNAALPADIFVAVAAVADWHAAPSALKLKKADGPPALALRPNPDILAAIARPGPERPRLVVGFAAETGDPAREAEAKRARKNCDLLVANDVSAEHGVMGGTENTVLLAGPGGVERWVRMDKRAVAERLAARIAEMLGR